MSRWVLHPKREKSDKKLKREKSMRVFFLKGFKIMLLEVMKERISHLLEKPQKAQSDFWFHLSVSNHPVMQGLFKIV